MSYSFRRFIEENFEAELKNAAAEYIAYDNTRGIPVQIRSVVIEDIDYSVLRRAEDTATFPVILKVNTVSHEDGCSYRHDVMMQGTLKGSFSADFQDIEIQCTAICKQGRNKFPVTYTDDLLPLFTKENIEKDAERLLDMVYRHTECPPHQINPIALAHSFGIRVFFVALSDDCSIRGEYFYKDTQKVLYDEKTGLHSPVLIKARTILVEKKLKEQPDVVRFTVMHELVHAMLQYHAYCLVCMCNPDFTSFFCPVRNDADKSRRCSYVQHRKLRIILENETGEHLNSSTTANQYITARIEVLNPSAGTISISTYSDMDGSYLNNAFIEKRKLVVFFQMYGISLEQ